MLIKLWGSKVKTNSWGVWKRYSMGELNKTTIYLFGLLNRMLCVYLFVDVDSNYPF